MGGVIHVLDFLFLEDYAVFTVEVGILKHSKPRKTLS